MGQRFLLFHHGVQIVSVDHPASCTMGTEGFFLTEIKRPGREADHSPSSNTKVKYVGAVPPLSITLIDMVLN